MRVSLVALVATGLGVPATAQDVQSQATVYRFEDGYRAVLYPMPGAQTVAVWTAYDRGWSDDPPDFPGAAHLVEHLWFRSRTPQGTLWDGLQDRGCQVNGHTSPSRTSFETDCASDALDYLLTAHAQLASDPLAGVTEVEVALENRVVRFEEAERETWSIQSNRTLLRQLLPAGDPIHEVWKAPQLARAPASLAQAQAWVQTAHAPEQATLIVTGGFDRAVVLKSLRQAHGAETAASPNKSASDFNTIQPPVSVVRATAEVPAPHPALLFGWTLPLGPSSASHAYASRLSSELHNALGDNKNVLATGCDYSSHAHIATLSCTALLQPQADLATIDTGIAEAVAQATSRKAGRQLKAGLREQRSSVVSELRSADRLPGRAASRLTGQVLNQGTASSAAQLIEAIEAYNPVSGIKAIREALTLSRMASVQVQPSESTAPLADPVNAAPQPARISALPEQPVELRDGPAAKRTLDNGLTVIAVQAPGSARTLASLRFSGGLATFPTGLTWIADRVSGTNAHRADGGVVTGEHVGADHAEVYAWADPGSEAKAIKQLLEVVTKRGPGFSSEDRAGLHALLDREIAQRNAASNAPRTVAGQALLNATVPGHGPSHGPSAADLNAMRQLSPSAVMAYVVQTYHPANGVLTLTGPQSPTELLDLAESGLARWVPKSGIALSGPMRSALAPPANPITGFVSDPMSPTATVLTACRLPDHTSQPVSDIVQELLFERAFRETRASTGWTYSPGVQVSAWPDGTTSAWVAIGSRAADAPLVLSAVEDLTRVPTADAVHRARTRAIRRAMSGRDSQVSTEAAVFAAMGEGTDPTTPLSSVQAGLEAVDLPQVMVALATCTGTRSWVVTGPPVTRTYLNLAGRSTEAP